MAKNKSTKRLIEDTDAELRPMRNALINLIENGIIPTLRSARRKSDYRKMLDQLKELRDRDKARCGLK